MRKKLLNQKYQMEAIGDKGNGCIYTAYIMNAFCCCPEKVTIAKCIDILRCTYAMVTYIFAVCLVITFYVDANYLYY